MKGLYMPFRLRHHPETDRHANKQDEKGDNC